MQWYETVPACLNVKLKVIPGFSMPESNDPSSAVTVWAVESLFVHFIVVPALTVRESGLKAKLAMVTSLPPEADEEEDGAVEAVVGMDIVGEDGALVGAAVEFGPVTGRAGEAGEAGVHAARITTRAIAVRTEKSFFITSSLSYSRGCRG